MWVELICFIANWQPNPFLLSGKYETGKGGRYYWYWYDNSVARPHFAAHPSILTNCWCWLNIRNSLSILHFSFNESTQNLQSFLPLVDDSLSSLRSPEGNPIIHSFVLNLHLVRERRPFDIKGMLYLSKIITYIHDWISLVLKNYVKHLKLSFSNITYSLYFFLRNSFSHWIYRVLLSWENHYFLVIMHSLIALKS